MDSRRAPQGAALPPCLWLRPTSPLKEGWLKWVQRHLPCPTRGSVCTPPPPPLPPRGLPLPLPASPRTSKAAAAGGGCPSARVVGTSPPLTPLELTRTCRWDCSPLRCWISRPHSSSHRARNPSFPLASRTTGTASWQRSTQHEGATLYTALSAPRQAPPPYMAVPAAAALPLSP